MSSDALPPSLAKLLSEFATLLMLPRMTLAMANTVSEIMRILTIQITKPDVNRCFELLFAVSILPLKLDFEFSINSSSLLENVDGVHVSSSL